MKWHRHSARQDLCSNYAREFDIAPLTAQLLINRGLGDVEQTFRFLYPDLSRLRDPFGIKNMDTAVRRLRLALVRGERVHVHGDYDVDGVSSTSVVMLALRHLGADAHYVVVTRGDSGVGLSRDSLDRDHIPHNPSLIITTDCGSNDHDAISYAESRGIDVIVIDHHQVSKSVPKCVAVLNPHQNGDTYAFKGMSAVGVAFQFVRALDIFLQRDDANWPKIPVREYVDIVALGTVADVVPLVDDNRIFVREGLKLIAGARRPGICAVMRAARLLNEARGGLAQPVTTRTIGFKLAPLINAAGRMGDASRCVELLITDSYRVAVKIARQLVEINAQRQKTEREVLAEATEDAERMVADGDQVIVVAREGWHPGVLGIVASRLSERMNRPAVVAAIKDGVAKGSVRSPSDVNILSTMSECKHILDAFGGHRVAAGFQLDAGRVTELRKEMNSALRNQLPDGNFPEATIRIDATIQLSELDPRVLAEFESLAPFGTGNPEPVLEARNVTPVQARVQGRHLRLRLRQGHDLANAVGYGMSGRVTDFGSPVDIVFSPRRGGNGGRSRVDLRLRDARSVVA